MNKKIPENSKEIGVARSYGDLRENFEFKAAKEMQAVLMRRKSELETALHNARGTAFESPDTSQDVQTYYQSAGTSAENRVKLLKLMWDFVGTEFAGRQLQYEMFYSAAQHIVDMRAFRYYDWEPARQLVEACLGEYDLGGVRPRAAG